MGHHHHFEDDDACAHVTKKKGEGHGTDTPSHLSAAADAMREGALVFLLLTLLLRQFELPVKEQALGLLIFAIALTAWKTGRSAWMGWARLERLHRVMIQEKYEIENHRDQEREELVALYAAKGFEGKLLDDVIDVLMADNDRLLKVMLEEEMGLSLASFQHPLKQSLGSFFGSLVSLGLGVIGFFSFGIWGVLITSLFSLLMGVTLTSLFEKNEWIPAAVWNLALAGLSGGLSFFLSKLLHIGGS
jgi:vacuolar iron transporter family protein